MNLEAISPLLLILVGGSLASTTRLQKVYYDPDEAEVHFEEFVRIFGRQSLDENEKQMRFEAFKENLKEINHLNSINPRAVYGITKFSDYTAEEKAHYGFILNMNKTKYVGQTCQQQNGDTLPIQAPDSFDWRDKNVISPAKDQRQCGSCWAFSAVGALESHYAIKYGKMMSFSEQQLVDCDKKGGCAGGFIISAYETMMTLGGIMTEADYSYKEAKNACQFDSNKIAAKLTGCTNYTTNDEEMLKNILYSKGPVALGFDAKSLTFYMGGIIESRADGPIDGHGFDAKSLTYYTGGIIESCADGPIDGHAVVFVGYGLENGEPYWIVKNSFGPDWGEKGFFRIRRGSDVCGIMNQEKVIPVVA